MTRPNTQMADVEQGSVEPGSVEPGSVEHVTRVAQDYYDSGDADAFYFKVWGGEDIHIGIYAADDESIADASKRSDERLASKLSGMGAGDRVIDLGSGYGGAARYLHQRFGCSVTCVNLSQVQNDRNRAMNAEAGMADAIEVHDAAFEAVPAPSGAFQFGWCQDAILHSGDKPQVFREIARLLAPGGRFVMTDPMQSDDVPPGALEKVLARIHLDHLGSFSLYAKLAEQAGLRVVETEPLTEHLITHYGRVRDELLARRDELVGDISAGYLDRMTEGLKHWVDAGRAGHLAWGVIVLEKPVR